MIKPHIEPDGSISWTVLVEFELGVVATACTQGKRTQHGRPQGVVRDDQPDAREGQAGRPGVTERFAVPRKPGNAGGGKGPQFKTNARRSEGPGDWATYQLREVFRSCRWRCTRKRSIPHAELMKSVTRLRAGSPNGCERTLKTNAAVVCRRSRLSSYL